MMTISRILSLFFVVAYAAGQPSNTVYQRIFTNATGLQTSAAVRNIGQSQHALFFVYSDNGGSCGASGSVPIYFEASQDGTNYGRISPYRATGNLSGTTLSGFAIANGAWPYIRIVTDSNPTNCKLNLWYSGTVPTLPFPQVLPATIAGYQSFSTGPSTAGTSTLITNPKSTGRFVIYAMDAFNSGASAQTIDITENTSSACNVSTTGIVLRRVAVPAATAAANWPASVVPYYISAPGGHLCLTIGSSVETNVRLVYRIE